MADVCGCVQGGGGRRAGCLLCGKMKGKERCGGITDKAQWGVARGNTRAEVSEVLEAMFLPTTAFVCWVTCDHATGARASSRNVSLREK